jgi:hypothetical protein
MLARPAKLKPQTVEAMPDITEGGRIYTMRVKKGIYFSDDPVFKGVKRELVAQDYIFAIQRLIDPKMASPNSWMVDGKIEGLDAMRDKAKKDGKLDYDAPISGLKALDPHTLQIRLRQARLQLPLHPCARHAGRAMPRGRGALRKRNRCPSGGHGPLRAEGMEALGEDRARAQPQLPRAVLRSRAGSRRRRGPAAARRDEGQAPAAIDRVEISSSRSRSRAGSRS